MRIQDILRKLTNVKIIEKDKILDGIDNTFNVWMSHNDTIKELPKDLRLTVVGTAIIIFVFRAMPGPGPGLSWFEIDELKFKIV